MESLFHSEIRVSPSQVTLMYYTSLLSEGMLNMNAPYQREYVWTDKEQQDLLKAIFKHEPIGAISVVLNEKSVNNYCEVVDGKQRLTTILMFMNDEIAYRTVDGKEVLFSQLSIIDHREFKKVQLPYLSLRVWDLHTPLPEIEKLKYFYRVNFSGVPQSDEHKMDILMKIGELL